MLYPCNYHFSFCHLYLPIYYICTFINTYRDIQNINHIYVCTCVRVCVCVCLYLYLSGWIRGLKNNNSNRKKRTKMATYKEQGIKISTE